MGSTLEQRMKAAAKRLKPVPLLSDFGLEVNYLTGDKYWHQTLFCAWSLATIMEGQVKINIYSDGSLRKKHNKTIEKTLPGILIKPEKQVDHYLNKVLPDDNYPTLRRLRKSHPFFRRLLDIHTQPSWSIHLDSDMLFLKKPGELINAFLNKSAIYMKDHLVKSYFVDDEKTLETNFGIYCKANVNGGIIAYDHDKVDYIDLERKAKLLSETYPNTGAAQLEQTLMSYVLYMQGANPLEMERYTIFFDSNIHTTESQIVQHYIFKAKLPYFSSEWKKIVR
jgi:hypothetical protein